MAAINNTERLVVWLCIGFSVVTRTHTHRHKAFSPRILDTSLVRLFIRRHNPESSVLVSSVHFFKLTKLLVINISAEVPIDHGVMVVSLFVWCILCRLCLIFTELFVGLFLCIILWIFNQYWFHLAHQNNTKLSSHNKLPSPTIEQPIQFNWLLPLKWPPLIIIIVLGSSVIS